MTLTLLVRLAVTNPDGLITSQLPAGGIGVFPRYLLARRRLGPFSLQACAVIQALDVLVT